MNYLAMLLLSVFCLSSCAEVQHLDEAFRLKEFSDNGDARDAMVASRQAQFKELVNRIASGDPLKDFVIRRDLISKLGEPVLIAPGKVPGQERWLYRDPVKYFDTPKVYFLIDAQGRILSWTPESIIPNSSSKNNEFRNH